jgi:hypothetical protein
LIRIRIGDSERTLKDAEESWINQQINRRRQAGGQVCVRVFIESSSVNMVLSTPECGNEGVRGRPPNVKEKSIFDLWDKLGLNKPNFHGGNLIAFLKQIEG